MAAMTFLTPGSSWRAPDPSAGPSPNTRASSTRVAHSHAAYRTLGHLVARSRTLPRSTVAARVFEGFMTALAAIATPRLHANVLLQHMARYFESRLNGSEKAELA